MSTGRKLLIGLIIIIFLILGFMVSGKPEGVLMDQLIMDFVHGNNNLFIIRIMEAISFLGSEVFLFPTMGTAIAYFTIKKRYYIAGILLVSSLGSFIMNHILKQIFQRPRPFEYFLVEQAGLSYPSGHSMVSMTMFLTIAYLLTRRSMNKKHKNRIWAAVSIYILLMGISRVFLGVHWPSDIIGGYAAGYVFFEVYTSLINAKLIKRDSN